MIEMIQSIDECREFAEEFYGDPQFSDPMLTNEAQVRHNLENCIGKPDTYLALGVYLDGRMVGLFTFLIVKEERYMEMLVGLSRFRSAYQEIFRHLEEHYSGYDADFVFNPRNHFLKQLLEARAAEFEPEQQKMVFVGPVADVDTSGVELYSDQYKGEYTAIHNKDTYWTAEKVVAALDRFRVLVAVHEERVVGYLDVTHCFEENEPYDLLVLEEYRGMGYGRKLLAKALNLNEPNGMMLMVNMDQIPAIRLFESMGFKKVYHQNNLTAHWKVSEAFEKE